MSKVNFHFYTTVAPNFLNSPSPEEHSLSLCLAMISMVRIFNIQVKAFTYYCQVDERISRLSRLEVDPASVEASVSAVDVIQKQEGWVRGRVEVGALAEPPWSLLAP